MMSTYKTVETSWSEIEGLTEQMRSAASNKDWMHVVDLAAQRHKDLLAHFEIFPVGPDNATFYQKYLNVMLKGEEQLQKIALDARKQLMREGASLQHQRKAVGAYINESRV